VLSADAVFAIYLQLIKNNRRFLAKKKQRGRIISGLFNVVFKEF